ncbi:MAG TPA: flagellar brake protein [Clostridiaceae bacterium]|nr:flagellar brake protein [Clostridiaceae bacterium]
MKLTDIRTGVKLELEIYNEFNEKIIPTFVSQFEHALDEKTAVIYAPISEGNIYPVRKGWVMYVYFLNEDNLYRFKAKVKGRRLKSNVALLLIELLDEIERIQRRQFYRFECTLPVKYRVVDSMQDAEENDPPFVESVTKDISGGGICIKVKESVPTGSLVECELDLKETHKIKFYGIVARVSMREDDPVYSHEIGVLFKQIEKRHKEEIIKYIFAEQRKLRKKGLI